MNLDKIQIGGVILAGGKSRRMDYSDKSLKKINKKTLLELVYRKAKKQVDVVAINSNAIANLKNLKNIEFLKDSIPGNLGPLSGVLTGLEWLKKKNCKFKWLITFPVDSPFFPDNLVRKLYSEVKQEKIVIAKSGGRLHPVFAMWHLDLYESLKKSIFSGIRKIDDFTINYKMKVVNFEIIDYDPFFNINNKNDLLKAKNINKLIQENYNEFH